MSTHRPKLTPAEIFFQDHGGTRDPKKKPVNIKITVSGGKQQRRRNRTRAYPYRGPILILAGCYGISVRTNEVNPYELGSDLCRDMPGSCRPRPSQRLDRCFLRCARRLTSPLWSTNYLCSSTPLQGSSLATGRSTSAVWSRLSRTMFASLDLQVDVRVFPLILPFLQLNVFRTM